MSGGSQPAPAAQPSQQTITSNPIAEWAQPTATALIGSSMQNAFNIDSNGNILGSRGFTPFGGATNAQGQFTGNPISQDQYNQQLQVGSLGVAGPSALQQQSYQGAANLQVPGQYNQASNMAGAAGIGALGTTGQAGMYGAQGDIAGQRAAGMSNMYGGMGAQSGQQAAGMSNLYGGLGAQSGQQYAGQSAGAGQQGSDIGQQYAGQSGMYGGLGAMAGQQGANIGQSLGQMSTNANAQQAYMNPYLQNSLQPQLEEMQRQYGITGTQQAGQATQQGAFGGGRDAVMAAENQRNKNMAMNQAIGQGYNTAFQNAQQQMNASNQAALAGNQQALSGYGMGLQGAGQAGTQALAGNQQALSGYGQAGSQALAGYGMGLQGAGQAGSQSLAGYGMGLQGAGQAGSQAMQGAGIGLQGVGAQQAGYGQAGQAGATLAGIGGQQLAAQQGILGLQNQMGTQEQQNQQNVINQAMQNYSNQQQYPQQQAANIMNLLRSTPTTQTQTQYAPPPSALSQTAGLAGTALAGYKLAGATGGLPKDFEVKKMAGGGIASGVPPGKLQHMLGMLSDEQLALKAKPQMSDPDTLAAVLGEQAFRTNARDNVPTTGFAPGGIVAFAEGGNEGKEKYIGEKEDDALINNILMSGLSGGMNPNFVGESQTPSKYNPQNVPISKQEDKIIASNSNKATSAPVIGKDFYKTIYSSAKEYAEEKGAKNPDAVAHVIATQAAAESGWGKSLSGQNNIFGIKGKGTVRSTLEDYGQGKVRVNQEFKDYPSIAAATKDAVNLMATNPRYTKVWNAREPIEGLNAQATSGYATAKDYGQLLHGVYEAANRVKKYAEGGITKYFGDPEKNPQEKQLVAPEPYEPSTFKAPVIPASVAKAINESDFSDAYSNLRKKIDVNEENIKAQEKQDPWWALLHGSLATMKAAGTAKPGEVRTPLGDIGAGGVEGVSQLMAAKKQRADQLKDVIGQRESLQKIQEAGDIQRQGNAINQQGNAVRIAIANTGNEVEMAKFGMLEKQFGAELAAKIYTGQLDKTKILHGAQALYDEAKASGKPITMEEAITKYSKASYAGQAGTREDQLRQASATQALKALESALSNPLHPLYKKINGKINGKELSAEDIEKLKDEYIDNYVNKHYKASAGPVVKLN